MKDNQKYFVYVNVIHNAIYKTPGKPLPTKLSVDMLSIKFGSFCKVGGVFNNVLLIMLTRQLKKSSCFQCFSYCSSQF